LYDAYETGAKHGKWINSWVFVKDPSIILDTDSAQCFYDLFSASSELEVLQTCLRNNLNRGEHNSYRNIRAVIIKHTLVIERADGTLIDCHADFMKHGVSEHHLFMLLKLDKVLRPQPVVQGDLPPGTVARNRAKAAARQRRVLAEAQNLVRAQQASDPQQQVNSPASRPAQVAPVPSPCTPQEATGPRSAEVLHVDGRGIISTQQLPTSGRLLVRPPIRPACPPLVSHCPKKLSHEKKHSFGGLMGLLTTVCPYCLCVL